MRVLLQRVSRAQVSVEGGLKSKIGNGLLLFVGVTHEDTEKEAQTLAEKAANLRIFSDEEGKMNLSLLDVEGAALVVSQFTLYGDCKKGRRPSFVQAAPPEQAEELNMKFDSYLKDLGLAVETGQFQAHMQVELVNDGPVTLMLET
ncbi:MAG: D-aminoacyl-tRNA deacylase [Candidatus Peregrinibacteria bacterium]|nr:D-aminoacyl-tRNA deacylase [Candidatus Peregrinibacteria bacterium]